MGSDFWTAFTAFSIAGCSLYRVLAKKVKQRHVFGSGIGVGVFFIIGVFKIIPFLGKVTAKWLFST